MTELELIAMILLGIIELFIFLLAMYQEKRERLLIDPPSKYQIVVDQLQTSNF